MNIGGESRNVAYRGAVSEANGTPVAQANPFRTRAKDPVEWVTGSNPKYVNQTQLSGNIPLSVEQASVSVTDNFNYANKCLPNEMVLSKPSTPESSRSSDSDLHAIPTASVCAFPQCQACVLPSI